MRFSSIRWTRPSDLNRRPAHCELRTPTLRRSETAPLRRSAAPTVWRMPPAPMPSTGTSASGWDGRLGRCRATRADVPWPTACRNPRRAPRSPTSTMASWAASAPRSGRTRRRSILRTVPFIHAPAPVAAAFHVLFAILAAVCETPCVLTLSCPDLGSTWAAPGQHAGSSACDPHLKDVNAGPSPFHH